MKRFAKVIFRTNPLLLGLLALQPAIFASVDDAQSFALQAAEPYVKQGFQVREDYWGGDLGSGEKGGAAAIVQGNEYWFWLGTEVDKAKVAVPFMIRMESWRKNQTAGRRGTSRLHVIPKTTGSYLS
jgi:hypothetical protein